MSPGLLQGKVRGVASVVLHAGLACYPSLQQAIRVRNAAPCLCCCAPCLSFFVFPLRPVLLLTVEWAGPASAAATAAVAITAAAAAVSPGIRLQWLSLAPSLRE